MDRVKPEPRASARADFLHAKPSANEQEEGCPGISQTAYLGLGSNLGDRLGSLRAAIHALDKRDGIRVDWEHGIPPVYETAPVGGPPDQPPYLNTAIRILTTLDPFELLAVTQDIELQLGRKRAERWASRAIDIDILLFGDVMIVSDSLTIPHPRMHERRFVLEPLDDIAPDLAHPGIGSPIREIVARLATPETSQPVVRLIGQNWYDQPTAGTLPL